MQIQSKLYARRSQADKRTIEINKKIIFKTKNLFICGTLTRTNELAVKLLKSIFFSLFFSLLFIQRTPFMVSYRRLTFLLSKYIRKTIIKKKLSEMSVV